MVNWGIISLFVGLIDYVIGWSYTLRERSHLKLYF